MPATATITEHEQEQIERANATSLTPVVFVHGLWLLPSSWDRWAEVFEAAGYTALTPGWPDDPETVDEANEHPEVFAHKTVRQVADHFDDVIRALDQKPAVIGHSFGGLLAQILAGRGLSAATVAIDPAPFRGVLPLPISALRAGSAGAAQPGQPPPRRPAHLRAVPLQLRQRGQRGRGQAAVRDLRRPGAGRAAVPGGVGEPQPVDRGQGRHARTRSAARC